MGDIRHLWTFTYHQHYIARAVFILRFSVTNRRMRLSFFFCAFYTPHHIYKSFPTYYDRHVNCPLLSVDVLVRIMLMSSVEQPARRMGSLCCSCTAVLLYCYTGVSQLVTSSAEKVLAACTHACSSEQTMLHTTQQQ